jgi:hypothetical protein
MREIGLEGR